MTNNWDFIATKLGKIQAGLLRFTDKSGRVSLQVKETDATQPASINCVIDEKEYPKRLVNQKANLMKKTKNGYLYITGYISTLRKQEQTVLSMNVMKAHWFERRQKAGNVWLEEVSMYEHAR